MNKYLILISFIFPLIASADQSLANRYALLSGVRQSKDQKNFWDEKYSKSGKYLFGKSPSKFLASNFDYIPHGGKVLDLGMGEGRNAVFLARKGFKVTGVDISSVAIRKAKRLAQEFGVQLKTVTSSAENYSVQEGSFDSIICFYFVDRDLNKKLVEWLRPGGILIYESHTSQQRSVKGSESYDLKYLLDPGELLTMFPGFKILKFEEPKHTGEFTSSIILQKPLI